MLVVTIMATVLSQSQQVQRQLSIDRLKVWSQKY